MGFFCDPDKTVKTMENSVFLVLASGKCVPSPEGHPGEYLASFATLTLY